MQSLYKLFKISKKDNIFRYLKFIINIIILFIYVFLKLFIKEKKIYFDKYDTKIYDVIKIKLEKTKCSLMWSNQREFLNGIIRKYRPKKIIEIGVRRGGSSIIILNAIKDIKNAHLYSIDIDPSTKIGFCVNNLFPNFKNKWNLYNGNIAANYIEQIGKNIDMAFFDTSHFEPGEILDFLMIFPFLKERALVGFHDIGHQINYAGWKDSRNEWAPYLIFNAIKGKKYLPSGRNILTQDIGFIRLDKNQYNYIHDYFRLLGGQWQYFPKEEHILIMKKFIQKYYDNECLIIKNLYK